jgi:mannose-1-phosphate guanylyltransferase/mannose-6-phosphate isomerase
MEKTDKGVMVPLKAGWDDLGTWEALWKVGQKNNNGNVIQGDVLTHDVKNSYLKATHRMIAAVGLENHIIIETSDAVLVSPRDSVQEVKQFVDQLRSNKRSEAILHRKVYRPWGVYEGIDMSNRFQVKRITVNPGGILSLQKHFHRSEHWIVVKGTAIVTKGGDTFILKEDESTYIPLGETHRLENPGEIDLELIEVQSGSYLGEDDIVRFEDVYGR